MKVIDTINGGLIYHVPSSAWARGIFFNDSPLNYAGPVLLFQLALSALLTAILHSFLTPFGETAFVSQSIVGVALGSSVFGQFHSFREMFFPTTIFHVTETFAYFGLMLFLFLVGVKMDINIVRKSGRRAVVIGICNFFILLALNGGLAALLRQYIAMDPLLYNSLPWIASFQCLSSFYVIACVLGDLNLLDSELGRLAISASMISGICSTLWSLTLFTARRNYLKGHLNLVLLICFFVASLIAVIVYVLRPLMLWMIRRTGENEAIKDTYIVSFFVMVLVTSMFSEIIGLHFLLGPMLLGLAVPEGPPLATALVNKLDSFVSSILLPIYFVVGGTRIDFSIIHIRTFGIMQLLAVFGFLWKVMGTMLLSLYCRMSINDAVSLGLIMSVQGITDVLMIGQAAELKYINRESYSIMMVSIVVFTAVTTPIMKFLYKPSRRYIAHWRRTIQHAKPGVELRMLACIYHEDQTPSIISLLEASGPSSKSPICFHVIHLIELSGRSAPLLVVHQLGKRTPSHLNHSEHIINAFRLYEQQNQGAVTVNQPFHCHLALLDNA